MKMNFAKTRYYLSTRFRLILLAGLALTLALFGRGVAVARTLIPADMNGDHKPDLVLQGGPGTQQTGIWYMDNNNFVGALNGPTLPVHWFIRGVADFDGDGHPDFLLENDITNETGIWYMNNNVFVGALNGPTLPLFWEVMTVGDFNGDGHPDLVLYNFITNETAIWYMNNNNFVSGKFGPTLPVLWFVMEVADMNGDGHPDFVLFNFATRETGIWYMNNNNFVGALSGPTLPFNWSLFGVADFNGDGHPDFLLRAVFGVGNRQTGIWYMNNNNFVGALFGPTLPVFW